MAEYRIDFGRLDAKIERTPQGGLRIPANLTRVGVFVYRNPDGSVRKEYRPAEEVFHADSMASLRGAPLTDLHPADPVTTRNYKTLSVGHVCDDVKASGYLVSATVLVQDEAVVAKVDNKERREISCGYTMKYDATPGVYHGERYDGVQREIRYNHVALGPVNWGRAGNEVALRLDGAGVQETETMKIVIDGKEYEVPNEVAAAFAAEKTRADDATARADASEKKVKAAEHKEPDGDEGEEEAEDCDGKPHKMTKDAASVVKGWRGKVEAERARADSLQTRLDSDAADFGKRVTARANLETEARRLLGKPEEKFDSKSDREIKLMVLQANPRVADKFKADASGKVDRTDAYIDAFFDSEASRPSASNHFEVLRAPTAPVVPVVDQAPELPPWQQPLAAHK